MSTRPEFGVVCLPVLDLRARPDHASEMTSQLLLGEVVDVVSRADRGRWLRVRNHADGYRGWVREWGIIGASRERARRWLARARVRVAAVSEVALARPGTGIAVSPLGWGARLIGRGRSRGHREVELPDGRRGWIRWGAVASIGARPMGLIERIESLIGVPYLWGGRSSAGLDCSGFTQLVLAEQGIRLPRDAHDQHRVCRRLGPRSTPRPGDLIFFGDPRRKRAHVGLYLGTGYYAHSRGRVRVASIETSSPLYDNMLMDNYRGISRPASGWRPEHSRIALTRFPELS
ncbi:MAG: C40 family peptidase [Candidatus Eisenbacteria bacterium]|nr:C40 family peptidase [Candidatus Eisenbacteria bacterium]